MSTFADCWRLVTLHAPVPDPMLARAWVQWAYDQFCDRKGWSHLRADTVISVADQKTGTATVAVGSATVLPGTLVFTAADVGRQLRLSTVPIYTIIAFNAGPGSVTLHRTYSEASGLVTASVLDAYVTLPEDFHRFISVLDPSNRWRLRYWVSQDELNRWDPVRQSSGSARMLVNQSYSPVVADLGKPRFELFPFQTSAKTFPVWYYRKSEKLLDDQVIIGPLSRRASEILLEGALSRCAMWPGTKANPNPYFNLGLAAQHRGLFEEKLGEIFVMDEEMYFESYPVTEFPYADFPWDAAWLQGHEPYIIG